MPPPPDIRSRLDMIAARKRRAILDDVRGGGLPGVSTAATLFADGAASVASPRRDPVSAARWLAESLPGFEASVEHGAGGRFYLLRRVYTPGPELPMAAPEPADPAGVPLLVAGGDAGAAPGAASIAFIDTETTGLAGGTGTVAFLVGVGWWEEHGGAWRFVLEQYLIDDFEHEEAMLARLAARLAPFHALCSYNGRRFDVPLLRARAIMHRMAPRGWSRPQIDLLDFSRRLWKARIGSVSLRNVEAHILGIGREGDIDGALIPGVFLGWARSGAAPLLPAVLRHNAQDIATLGALLCRASRIAADPLGCGLVQHHADLASVARWHERLRRPAEARAAWERALHAARTTEEERPLLHRLALHLRRTGAREEAAAIWESLPGDPEAALHLAKHLEHYRRDPAAALRVVRGLRQRLEWEADMAALRDGAPGAGAAAMLADLTRREERLLRKAGARA